MDDQAAHVADVGEVAEEGDGVHEPLARLHTVPQLEGDHGPGAARQVPLPGLVPGAGGQSRVVDDGHLVAGLEPFGERQGVGGVPLQAQAERLDALEQQEGAVRGEGRAEVAEQLDAELDGEGAGAEVGPVPQAVVAGVGRGEVREALGVSAEVEAARVHHDAAEGGAVAAEELGGGVDDDVGAVLGGAQQVRGGHGVVDDEGDAGLVGDVGDAPDVEDVAARVAEALGEDRLGGGADRGAPGVEVVRVVDEGHLDAQARQGVPEQVVGAAVQGGAGDEVVAGAGQGEQGEGLGGLPGGEGDSGDPAFEGGDALLQDVLGGVVDAGVDVARFGEREEPGGVPGVVEDERGRLVDRHRPGAGGRVGDGPRVDLPGLERPGGLGGFGAGGGVGGLAHVWPRTGRPGGGTAGAGSMPGPPPARTLGASAGGATAVRATGHEPATRAQQSGRVTWRTPAEFAPQFAGQGHG